MSGMVLLILRILMAICLYAFIGLVIYIVWKDLRQQAALASHSRIPSVRIMVPDSEPEQSFFIEKSEGFIGRDPACEAHLDEATLSSRHARLRYHHKQWWVEDLNSTNGSLLNDQPLLQAAVLESGDRLTCGKINLVVEIKQPL
jgi:hypothetical protein